MSVKVKTDKQPARVATNLAIGIVGLLLVRLITQLLPMFHDAGWIVEDKLTVQGRRCDRGRCSAAVSLSTFRNRNPRLFAASVYVNL